jgi:hypothetical protein
LPRRLATSFAIYAELRIAQHIVCCYCFFHHRSRGQQPGCIPAHGVFGPTTQTGLAPYRGAALQKESSMLEKDEISALHRFADTASDRQLSEKIGQLHALLAVTPQGHEYRDLRYLLTLFEEEQRARGEVNAIIARRRK